MTNRTCSIEGCEDPHLARGWCSRHYYNWQRNGDPLAFKRILPKRDASLEDRLWAKVNKDGPVPAYAPHLGKCWIWTASLNAAGYGKFGVGDRAEASTRGAHCVTYEVTVGPIPDGLQLDHLCRVRACVNPSHLEPVTGAENMRRAMLAKTHCDNGHLFDEGNTRWYRGVRRCRACDRDAARLKRQRPAVPGMRSTSISVKLSEADAALIDSARKDERRSAWMRAVMLTAAEVGTSAPGNRDRQDEARRTVQVHILATQEEVDRIDAARGGILRGIWIRRVAVAAASARFAA